MYYGIVTHLAGSGIGKQKEGYKYKYWEITVYHLILT